MATMFYLGEVNLFISNQSSVMCFISCSHSSSKYRPGAITVYALNVNKYYPVTIKVNEEFSLMRVCVCLLGRRQEPINVSFSLHDTITFQLTI